MEKGFFASLFDLSFKNLVFPKLVKLIYALCLVGFGFMILGMLGAAFTGGALAGLVMLLLSPVIYLIMVIYVRSILEFMIVMFQIADDVRALRKMKSAPEAPPVSPDTPVVQG